MTSKFVAYISHQELGEPKKLPRKEKVDSRRISTSYNYVLIRGYVRG